MKKSNWHGGKGSGRRSSQDDKKYADNWDKIFGKDQKTKQKAHTELNWDGDIEYPQRTNVSTRNK